MTYYIHQNDKTGGPYTLGQLRSMWCSGMITGKTLALQEGAADWFPLSDMAPELEAPVPAAPAHVTTEATGKKWKAMQVKATTVAVIAFGLLIAFMIAGTSPIIWAVMGIIMLAGLGVYYWAKAKAWWHHG